MFFEEIGDMAVELRVPWGSPVSSGNMSKFLPSLRGGKSRQESVPGAGTSYRCFLIIGVAVLLVVAALFIVSVIFDGLDTAVTSISVISKKRG